MAKMTADASRVKPFCWGGSWWRELCQAEGTAGAEAGYCCVTNHSKIIGLKGGIYHLAVSVGWEPRQGLAGSFDPRSLTRSTWAKAILRLNLWGIHVQVDPSGVLWDCFLPAYRTGQSVALHLLVLLVPCHVGVSTGQPRSWHLLH